MPRWLAVVATVAVAGAALATIALTTGRGGPGRGHYVVELDNAFGLTDGSDVKLGGVRAGVIDGLALDQRTRRAVVGIRLTLPGFDSLRRDAFCQVRPQSLIGEYFLDCQPGRGRALPAGGTIPVRQTGSAIGFDLLNVALRRPNNERLRLLLGELGAGVAARGPQLNAALGRALPALRETNRVLRILAEENQTLADLVLNGDRALSGIARRRSDVARFVREAGNTAAISARRRAALAEQWRRYPGFLDQLAPAMRDLGSASDAQAGALHELSAGSDRLRSFFGRLAAFSQASRPAISALGRAAHTGRLAASTARPALDELGRAAQATPELARNAAIVFEHLDNRANAAEPDPRSPGGKGFTGMEGLLQYIYNQSQAVNTFNADNYFLKVNLIDAGACGKYADVKAAREHPECWSWLGPNLPGITDGTPATRAGTGRRDRSAGRGGVRAPAAPAPAAATPPAAPSASAPAPAAPKPSPPPAGLPPLPRVPDVPPLPGLGGPPPQQKHAEALLDYLLGS